MRKRKDGNGQFDLGLGQAAKEEGIARVAVPSDDFVNIARAYGVGYAEEHGLVSADEVRLHTIRIGIKPHHPNAWGAIFHSKEFESVGWKPSQFVSNHARPIRVWKLRARMPTPPDNAVNPEKAAKATPPCQ